MVLSHSSSFSRNFRGREFAPRRLCPLIKISGKSPEKLTPATSMISTPLEFSGITIESDSDPSMLSRHNGAPRLFHLSFQPILVESELN
jgi:hypothetical protein